MSLAAEGPAAHALGAVTIPIMPARTASTLRVLASSSRMSILHVLQRAGAPVPVEDVARQVGLHHNTVREHLERLRAAGFVEREAERRTTRGRPHILYRCLERPAGASLDEHYRAALVRAVLAGYDASGRVVAGERAGDGRSGAPDARRRASSRSAQTAAPAAELPAGCRSQVAVLEAHLEDLGLDPVVEPDPLAVHLHRCPFGALARERTEEVCSVHLALVRDVLHAEGGPVEAVRLEPFVGPDHCVLHLAVAHDAPAAERGAGSDALPAAGGAPGPSDDEGPGGR